MYRSAKSLLVGAALLGLAAQPAAALEPANASDIIALYASQGPLSDECPYLPYSSGTFIEIGPDADMSQPFVVPPGYVFVATSFHWHGTGAQAGAVAQANVRVPLEGPPSPTKKVLDDDGGIPPLFPVPNHEREDDEVPHYNVITSSATAGIYGVAGTTDNFPTGIALRSYEGRPICLGMQEGNDHMIGFAYMNGYLAPDN